MQQPISKVSDQTLILRMSLSGNMGGNIRVSIPHLTLMQTTNSMKISLHQKLQKQQFNNYINLGSSGLFVFYKIK